MKTNPSQPSPTNLSDELKTILDNFARWTIQNVEHGIYIPLPSPETKAALHSMLIEAENRGRLAELFNMPFNDGRFSHEWIEEHWAARIAELTTKRKPKA